MTIIANAQTLIGTNKLWYVVYYDDFYNSTTAIFKFKGDTTFATHQYKKLYSTWAWADTSNWNYVNAMREDSTSKIYLHTDTGDVLYYNFNLIQNDTFIFRGHQMFVDSVNNVVLNNNETRKRIYFSDTTNCGDIWITGIGSMRGLTFVGFLGCNEFLYPPNVLSCFFENDTLNYPNVSIYSCDQEAIGIKKICNKNSINIFPNPVTNSITIENQQQAILEILNIQGQTILQQQIQPVKTDIDISAFTKGVYILRLCSHDKTAMTKIVKE